MTERSSNPQVNQTIGATASRGGAKEARRHHTDGATTPVQDTYATMLIVYKLIGDLLPEEWVASIPFLAAYRQADGSRVVPKLSLRSIEQTTLLRRFPCK